MSLYKRNKIIVIVLAVLLVGGYFGYRYMYKPHTTLDEMEVVFKGTSQDFLEKIKENPDDWAKGEKVIELNGKITAKDDKGVMLNEGIYFQLAEGVSTAELQKGQTIKIKGRIIGYDDLLEELKLDKAVIVK